MSGAYSFGAGFGRIKEGRIAGDRITYRWSLPPNSGQGVIGLEDGTYNGAWGVAQASSGGGSISLVRVP